MINLLKIGWPIIILIDNFDSEAKLLSLLHVTKEITKHV